MKKRRISILALICALCCAIGLIGCSDGAGDTTVGLVYIDIAPIGCEVTGIGTANAENLVIPTAHKMSPVKRIAGNAFENNTEIKSVEIGAHVTTVGSYAFSGCTNLQTLNIPARVHSPAQGAYGLDSSLETIGDHAFYGCTSLKTINLCDNVAVLGDYVFSGCSSIESIELSVNVVTVGKYAFENCTGLTSIELPTFVTTLSEGVFAGCTNLQSITISEHVSAIKANAFDGCASLTGFVIPEKVTKVGVNAFKNCNQLLQTAGGVKYSGKWVVGCEASATTATLTADMKFISDGAFVGSNNLTTIIIPNTVTSIGEKAFEECGNLTKIEYDGTKAQWLALYKKPDKDAEISDYIIQCTDGKLDRDGKVVE